VKLKPGQWLRRKWRNMAKYDWMASNSAPRGCPIELIDGNFVFPNKGSLYIPPKLLHAGWGMEVSKHVVGDDTKSLPDSFDITFYSYLEDKFYRGSFPLPHDRIADLFAEGFTLHLNKRPSQHITYDAIVAGVAPGGAVAVWVSGISRQVEVFFGHAKEVDLDWHATLEMPSQIEREANRQKTLSNATTRDPLVAEMQKALPLGLWAAYRARYLWQPVFEGMKPPERLGNVNYLNGERDYLELPLDAAAQNARRPVPTLIVFTAFEAGRMRAYEVTFDEVEMLAVFPRLGRGDTPLELVFHYRPERDDSQVLLRNARESVTLEHVKITKSAG
jgi:hypothetical protein